MFNKIFDRLLFGKRINKVDIKKSVENGIEVKLGATIMGQSKEEIEELVVTAKNLKVSMIELGNLISQGEAVKNNLSSKIEEIQEFRKCLNEKYKEFGGKRTLQTKKKKHECRAFGYTRNNYCKT